MSYITVQCNHCMHIHDDIRPYDISNICNDCRWCGTDVCKYCSANVEKDIHFECLNEEKESDEKEYNGN